MDLRGQRILVTGASRGIGAAIARRLLEDGAQVALHYNSSRQEAEGVLRGYEDQGVLLPANLADPDRTRDLFENALKALGHLDALVLNAGVFLPHPIEEELDQWWAVWKRTLAINLDAPGLLTQMALRHFQAHGGGGRLIYIGSRAAFRGETREFLGYAASKGGLTSLARSVARSFGKDNVKSFVIAPGFTRTAMADTFVKEYGEQRLLDEIALNTLTLPEDIAPLTAFICSGQMDHATGTVIDINAGSYMH
ncbi:SDR family NAD(P)-dependent oxidoreductase [Robiginitalea sediminis]|uniref:SDR family NAD(P)-dependent oxidoreductase n=1 Tax=Robiginitalea sediminis TaxID=1982593 RepID=UPI000B4AF5BF|nr:SDR family oxidoreductase [Robiginitalea sediminis]